jgi:hypothetical protein
MKKLSIALGVSLLLALAGCSSSSSGGTTPGGGATSTGPSVAASSPAPGPVATGAAGIATATKQLKANWATLFNSKTPHSKAVTLLQNGSKLGPAVKDAAKIAKKEKTKESAKVTKITFAADGMSATVIYTLFGNGTALLKNSSGTAVIQDGEWKVSQITFCTLVDLGASTIGLTKVPGC